MKDTVKKLIYYFLQYRRDDNTADFLKLKHNADLCPNIKLKIEDIVGRFNKYRTITYDIQGFKDDGTDIVVRLSDNNESKYICFQIKSNDDLKDKDYLLKIKAQATDTRNDYNNDLLDYYILLCCDTTGNNNDSNKNKVRQISVAFNKEHNIHVIEPAYVMGFLNISSLLLDVLIKNQMSEEDIVIRSAIEKVIDLTPTERAIIYYLSYEYIFSGQNYFKIEDIYYDSFITEIYSKVKDYDREWFFTDNDNQYRNFNRQMKQRIISDLEYLSNSYINFIEENKLEINVSGILPIISLILDGFIRYDYDKNETLNYIMILLQGMKGYEF